ncbi:unnamed protein product [Peniophora sp. CBMAI 1063]|nr:unnamed protein product [Peniophora sp. CBMAI 1063]
MSSRAFILLAFASVGTLAATTLKLTNNFAGQGFFDGFNFNITDPANGVLDPNAGNINYVNSSTAMNGPVKLAFVNGAGNVILRVDNTTNDPNPGPYSEFGRNTVQIVSKDPINVNTLLVASIAHIPFGCSVWPAFWTLDDATRTDHGGEIDIIESINLQTQNQYSLHTRTGCTLSNSSSFPRTGVQTQTDNCDSAANGNAGCIVQEPAQNSVGASFAGGVYAMYWSNNGVQMWFFPKSSVPSDLASNTPDPSTWPTPGASYPASTCDPTTFFSPQAIIFDIEVCGANYAGLDSIFHQTCPSVTHCQDLVRSASNYDNAYWEINYVKTFTGAPAPVANSTFSSASVSASGGSSTGAPSTSSSNSSDSSSGNSSNAVTLEFVSRTTLYAMIGTILIGAIVLVM